MEKNIFKLDNEQLKVIACSFRDKIELLNYFVADKNTNM